MAEAQYVEIGYPMALSEVQGKVNTGIGYIHHIHNTLNFDFKGAYSIFSYKGYELRDYALSAGYVIYFMPINWYAPLYRRMTASIGYGWLENNTLDNTSGLNFHLAYTLIMDGRISPMITFSVDNYLYGKSNLDNQEFKAQMTFVSVNLGFGF